MRHLRTASLALASIVVVTGVAIADGARRQTDFAAANDKALSGDGASAISLYETLLASGVNNEDLFYNLGNAYAESGRLVDAAVAYERALRLNPADEDARANLDVVREALLPKAPTAGEIDEPAVVADWVELLVAPFPAEPFAWLAALANALLIALMFVRRRAATARRRRAAALGLIASLVALVISGSVVLGYGVLARDPRGVATENQTMKAGPHPRFEKTDHVRAGDRVRVLGTDGDWFQIQRQSGTTGWVPGASITRL